MKFLRRLGCKLGLHRRNPELVRRAGMRSRSACAGCGKPMVRRFGHWHLEEAAPD